MAEKDAGDQVSKYMYIRIEGAIDTFTIYCLHLSFNSDIIQNIFFKLI